MTTSDALSDEDWGRGLQQYGQSTPDNDYDAEDLGDVDVAALMADDDDDAPTGPVDLDAGQDGPPKERFDHKLLWGFGGLVAAAPDADERIVRIGAAHGLCGRRAFRARSVRIGGVRQ